MKKIQAQLVKEIVSTNSSDAFSLYKKSVFGEPKGQKINYSLSEALYLVEKGKIEVLQKNKVLSFDELFRKFSKIDKRFQIKYPVFKDLRDKGHIVKTALKFGADFRVYKKGTRPGKGHSDWVVFSEHESKKFSWHEFSSKNRVAHSTKKNLLIAILDEEGDITYYEIKWMKV